MQHPEALVAQAIHINRAFVDVDQGVFPQRGNRAVVGNFFTTIIGGGGGGEHFDDELRLTFHEFAIAIGVAAGDKYVRVEIVLPCGDLEFHVAHVDAASSAGEVVLHCECNVPANEIMLIVSIGNFECSAIYKFVSDGLRGVPNYEIGCGEWRVRQRDIHVVLMITLKRAIICAQGVAFALSARHNMPANPFSERFFCKFTSR